METLLAIIFISIGGFLLAKGADWLVQGSSSLAARYGVSALVIGLTLVALGTSAPELAASIIGGGEIALGNITGSNMMNIGLILGITALIMPLDCQARFLRFEMPIMVLTGPLLLLFALNGTINRLEAGLLIVGLISFVTASIIRGRRGDIEPVALEFEVQLDKTLSTWSCIWRIVLGIAFLVSGGKLLVDGAVDIAGMLGISERVIAVTIVAGGTSLPELATCVVAARKGEGDIALGNIVGSNIFNILGIVGAASLVSPIAVSESALWLDIPAVIAIQLACLPIMITKLKVRRWEGAILLVFYAAYIVWLFFGK